MRASSKREGTSLPFAGARRGGANLRCQIGAARIGKAGALVVLLVVHGIHVATGETDDRHPDVGFGHVELKEVVDLLTVAASAAHEMRAEAARDVRLDAALFELREVVNVTGEDQLHAVPREKLQRLS